MRFTLGDDARFMFDGDGPGASVGYTRGDNEGTVVEGGGDV